MRRPPRVDRGQQGAALILAFLVLMVIIVVAAQVQYRASLELEHAHAFVDAARTRVLADAARQHVQALLLLDVEPEEGGEPGGDPPPGGPGPAPPDPAGTPGEEAPPAGDDDVTATTDSVLDEWMNPAALAPPIGEELQIIVEVVDEDSKLNPLGLWAADEEIAQRHREIMIRLLDKAFEGTSLDLSYGDASDVVDELDDWVEGKRGTGALDERIPEPKLKKDSALEEDEDALESSFGLDVQKVNFPLTLGELLMFSSLQPEHLWGFLEDDTFHPGLERYLTLHNHLELQAAADEEDEGVDESKFGIPDEADEEEEAQDELYADPTFNGLVNVNTAPLVVLRAMADEAISTASLEKIVEFRKLALEKLDEVEDDLGGALLDGGFEGEPSEDDEADEPSDQEKEASEYVFTDPGEVFELIEEEFHVSVNADEELVDDFLAMLGVESQVFTVKILIYDPETVDERTEEPLRRHAYRAVCWRMLASDRPRVVTLLPLEAYPEPRRLVDFEHAEAFQDALRLPPGERREAADRERGRL